MPSPIVKQIERRFKSFIDFLLDIPLSHGRNIKPPIDASSIKSILILRQDKLGDMAVTIPLIQILRQKFPNMKIEIVASPRNKVLIEYDPAIDAVHLYKKDIRFDWPLIKRLKTKKYDIIYDPITVDSQTGLLLSKLIGRQSIKAAAKKDKHKKYYDFCGYDFSMPSKHNLDNILSLLSLLGIDQNEIDPLQPVYLSENDRSKADKYMAGLGADNRKLIGINISAGSDSRMLSDAKYAETIKLINRKRSGFRFILFCTMDDRFKADKIVQSSDARISLIPPNLSLLEAVAILKRLDLFVSPDTSMVHLARLFKIPVVGLYSGHKVNVVSWRPYGQRQGAVVANSISSIHDIEPETIAKEFELVYDEFKSTIESGGQDG